MPPATAVRRALAALAAGEHLDRALAAHAFDEIMAGDTAPAAIGALLLALRVKGESPDELAGVVTALRRAMRVVHVPSNVEVVDTCGTGGGRVKTLNVSTAAAFVAAGAGVPLAKHGNRSFTSRSGSADVLEALGIGLDAEPERASVILENVGMVFLFAPLYHPAMRHLAPVRREIGVTTVMNLTGPLANPAMASRQVVGVADRNRAPLVAHALMRLGAVHAMVVHAEVGMDEVSPMGTTAVWEVRDGAVGEWLLEPDDVGLAAPSLDGVEGGEPEANANRIRELLERPASAPIALRNIVLLNAAAAIYVSGKATSLGDAAALAGESLYSRAGAERLQALRAASPISTS